MLWRTGLMVVGSLLFAMLSGLLTQGLAAQTQTPELQSGSKVTFGLARPRFDGLKNMDSFYGRPGFQWLSFNREETFFETPLLGLGAGFGLSSYSDRGSSFRRLPGGDVDFTSPVEKTSLRLINWRLFTSLEVRPFHATPWTRILTTTVYLGYEDLAYFETRLPLQSPKLAATAASNPASRPLTNKGSQGSLVYGLALNLRINGLDSAASAALRNHYGVHSAYLTPYFERSQDLGRRIFGKNTSPVNFAARTSLGILLTFDFLP